MPAGSDTEEPEDVVFLSPDESPTKEGDQGASPALRRSNRKRKSVTAAGTTAMTKGSSSKKKKPCTPNNKKSIPKVVRSPPSGGSKTDKQTEEKDKDKEQDMSQFEKLLRAMEDRLTSRMEANNKGVEEAVKLAQSTNEALNNLEEKVDSNDERLREMVVESEERVMLSIEANEAKVLGVVKGKLKGMVDDQLREAGFDPELTAGMMETPAGKFSAAARS